MESRECKEVRELVSLKIRKANDGERGKQRRARVDGAVVDGFPYLYTALGKSFIREYTMKVTWYSTRCLHQNRTLV